MNVLCIALVLAAGASVAYCVRPPSSLRAAHAGPSAQRSYSPPYRSRSASTSGRWSGGRPVTTSSRRVEG